MINFHHNDWIQKKNEKDITVHFSIQFVNGRWKNFPRAKSYTVTPKSNIYCIIHGILDSEKCTNQWIQLCIHIYHIHKVGEFFKWLKGIHSLFPTDNNIQNLKRKKETFSTTTLPPKETIKNCLIKNN